MNQFLDRGRELAELDGVVHQLLSVLAGERLEIGQEGTGLGDVPLRLLVVSAVDGVVGALEQQLFAVGDEFPGEFTSRGAGRDDDAGGDVVLGLHLCRGLEVVAQTEQPPRTVGGESHPQHVHADLLPVET